MNAKCYTSRRARLARREKLSSYFKRYYFRLGVAVLRARSCITERASECAYVRVCHVERAGQRLGSSPHCELTLWAGVIVFSCAGSRRQRGALSLAVALVMEGAASLGRQCLREYDVNRCASFNQRLQAELCQPSSGRNANTERGELDRVCCLYRK